MSDDKKLEDKKQSAKKRQKALHALCLSKSWRPKKKLAFHSYKKLFFSTGCLDVMF